MRHNWIGRTQGAQREVSSLLDGERPPTRPTSTTPTRVEMAIIVFSGRPTIEMMISRLLCASSAEVRASIPGSDARMAATVCSGV